MSQPQDNQVQDVRTSRDVSRENEDMHSNRATSGSSDPGSDEFGLMHIPSQSSDDGHQKSTTKRLLRTLRDERMRYSDTAHTAQGVSPLDGSSLRGLTPAPLPPDLLPNRKRSLGEVLSDESPPRKDKLSAEIDELSGETRPPQPLTGSPSRVKNITSSESHQRKKSRVSGEPSVSNVSPTVIGSSATVSDGR